MFGDMGHGMLLILLGCYLFIFREPIANSKVSKGSNESVLKLLLPLRYIILFFGFCAFYCGLIYNEFFSLPIPVFNSCYESLTSNNISINNTGNSNISTTNNISDFYNFNNGMSNFKSNSTSNITNIINNGNISNVFATSSYHKFGFGKLSKKKNCVYPIGVDPAWNIAKNELNFLNSLKMKLSVIIGVLHMMLGILLSGVNFINKKQYSNLLTDFLPKIIFMGVLFGYLCVMIVFKWTTDWDAIRLLPPSLINQFLNIFLKGGVIV